MRSRRIYVTEQDHTRLRHLIDEPGFDAPELVTNQLANGLDHAHIVAQTAIPPNIVTLNSRVEYRGAGEEKTCTLVYPWDAHPASGKLSILSPLGAAMLGRAAGDHIECELPNGIQRRYEITRVLYQPEAAGDLHL